MRKALVPLCLAIVLVTAGATAAGGLFHMVRVINPRPDEVATMAKLGLPLDDSKRLETEDGHDLEIPLRDTEVTLLVDHGIAHRIVQRDLEAHYGAVCEQNLRTLAGLGKAGTLGMMGGSAPTNMSYGSMGGFYKFEEITNALARMHQMFPDLCTAATGIGTTTNGNPILMVKISDNPGTDEDEPECLIDGLHHAREPGTYTAILYAMWYLLENYGTNPEATYLVNSRELYFVPVVNPDGLLYNQQNNPSGGGMWRKNRRNNGSSYGVDLNRNYPYKWAYDDSGSSPSAGSDTYRGPAAASEPETQAMMAFTTNRQIKTAMSIHTHGGYYLYPYGYADVATPHADVFAEYAARMAKNNGYTAGPAASTLYACNGVTFDWQVQHDIIGITPEIGTHSFWPPLDRIMTEAAENLPAHLLTFWCAGAKVESTSLEIEDGTFSPGQTENLLVTVSNMGWSASEDITVSISCANSNITVLSNIWTVGSLARRTGTNNTAIPFVIEIDSACPVEYAVRIAVTVEQGGYYDTSTYIIGSGGLCPVDDSFQYVLITSQGIRDAGTTPNVHDLIAHKKACGLTATIVTIEDILATDQYNGADDAEALRNFIRDAYNNWETEYVLLGGDINIIPMRKLYCVDGATDHIPSDLYYQCLDGSYNRDGDDKWGEDTDGDDGGDIDMMAEVYLGRASVENADEMANFVYKTLAYENHPPADDYLRGVLMGGQYLGSQFGPDMMAFGKSYMIHIHHTTNSADHYTVGFDSCELFNVDGLYQWDDDQAGRDRWGADDMLSRMNSNKYAVINHIGHGSPDFGLNIRNSNVASLTNVNPFFVWAEDCSPGAFDNDCLAERLTSQHRHGAYGCVLNSRYGWGCLNDYPWSSFDGPTLRVHREFWDAYFAEYIVNIGALHADSHEDVIWMLDRENTRWCIYDTILFCDPHTPMRGQSQKPMLVYCTHDMDDSDGGNSDGIINPGETVDLLVTLKNVGLDNATGVVATLSTTDTYVTVTQNFSEYGDIPGTGASLPGLTNYTLQVATNCPTPHEVSLVLNITDTAGTNWISQFEVMVYTSSQVSGNVTRDGLPEPEVKITWSGPLPGSILTDTNGYYMFGSINGTYNVVASKSDWLSSAATVITIPPNVSNVNFSFTTASISGRVTDMLTGNPIEDATVAYTGELCGSVQTDSNGDYTITRVYGRPATLTLVASHPSYFDSDPVDILQPPDATNINFQLGTSDIRVNPSSYSITTEDGTIVTQQLTISNVGGARLKWSTWNEGISASDTAGDTKKVLDMPSQVPKTYGVAFDGTHLWVSSGYYTDTDLYKVDPSDGNLAGTLPISGVCERPYGLAWGGDRLWIAGYYDYKIYAVDPSTGAKLKEFDAPEGVRPVSVAWDGKHVWMKPYGYSSATLYKLDANDGSILDTIEITEGIDRYSYGFTYCNGALWLPAYYGPDTYKVDPESGEITGVITSRVTYAYDACGDEDGGLWMTCSSSNQLHLVDSGDPSWLKEIPNKGSVPGLGTTNITVTFDAIKANPGLNRAIIHVRSNDPDQPDETVPVDFLVTSPYTISGTARQDGAPLADVTVVHTGPYSAAMQTASNGTYSMYVSEGVFSLVASYGDYLDSAPLEVTIPPSGTNVDFEFTTATISGRVTDTFTGEPIEGATVTYSGALTGAVQTASNGTYSITRVFGRATTLSLVAGHTSYYDTVAQEVTVPPDAPGTDFTMGIPDIDVAPTSIVVTAGLHQVVSRNIVITNSGGTRLNWAAWNQIHEPTSIVSFAAGDIKRQFDLPSDITYAYGAAWDGQVLWISEGYYGSELFKLDPYDGHEVGRLDIKSVCERPWGLGFDGSKLWITDYYDDKIYAIDPSTGAKLKEFPAPGSGSPVSITFGSGKLWVNDYSDDKIYKLNPDTGQVEGSFNTPNLDGYIYGVTYFNEALWTCPYYGDGNVYKFSTENGNVLTSFTGPENGILGAAADRDSAIWLVSYTDDKAYLVESGEVTWLTEDPKRGFIPSLGSQVVAVNFDGLKAGLGTHRATVHVSSDDPDHPDMPIDVVYTVTNDNRAPVISDTIPASPHTMPENSSQAFTVTASDPDSDPLTYSWKRNGSTIGGAKSASYTYSPNYSAAGTHSLKVTVNDGWGGITSYTWTVIVENVNRAPTASNMETATPPGVPISITLRGTDPDNDPLNYTLLSSPNHGSLTGAPPALVYTPTNGFKGSDSFTFKVDDGDLESNVATVKVLVASFLPGLKAEFFDYTSGLSKVPDLSGRTPDVVRLDTTVNYPSTSAAWAGLDDRFKETFASRHTGAINVQSNGEYTLYIKSDDGSKLWLNGELIVNNDGKHGMSEKSATRSLAPGYHAIRIEFFENSGGAGLIFSWAGPGIAKEVVPATSLFHINEPPVAHDMATWAMVDTPRALTLTATDFESTSLVYTVVSPPSNGTLTGTAPDLTYIPAAGLEGTDTFTFVANDGDVDSAPATVTITICSAIGEAGTVNVDQTDSNMWQTVTLSRAYSDPVVVMGVLTYNGSAPCVVRVRNTAGNTFECQVDEWDYDDGSHPEETLSYIVVETGIHRLVDGRLLIAGTTDVANAWETVTFGQSFSNAPAVLSQCASYNGASAVTTRERDISTDSFELRLQEEEAADGSHASETVAWLAMATGGAAGTAHEAGVTGSIVDETWHTISLLGTYAAPPVLVPGLQTYAGGDPCTVRCRNRTTTSIEAFVEEEKSSDDEITHSGESVGYAVFEAGPICGSSLSNDNDGDGIPDAIDPDDDNDGMPDWWETANLLDPMVPDADEDADGDGLTNGAEYIAGTNPRSPESVFKIGSVCMNGAGCEIRFDTVTGRLYAVQCDGTMMTLAPWSTLGEEISGTGDEITITDTNMPACRFYRVRVRLE